MEEACKSLKLVRFFIFSPLSFSSRRFFFVGGFCPTDFTDLHRFLWNLWWISLSNLRGYLQRPDRSHLRKSVSNRLSSQPPNKFREIRWIKNPMRKNLRHLRNLRDLKNVPINICVYLWNLWDIFHSQGVSATTGQVASAKSAWQKKQIYTDDSPRFYTFYLVISLFNHTFASNFKVVHF